MQITSILAALPLLACIALAEGEPDTIVFCNEDHRNEGIGPCTSEVIELGVCKKIPDSNATGDEGSYLFLYGVDIPNTTFCVLYASEDCSKGQDRRPEDRTNDIFAQWSFEGQGNLIYRSYECWYNPPTF